MQAKDDQRILKYIKPDISELLKTVKYNMQGHIHESVIYFV